MPPPIPDPTSIPLITTIQKFSRRAIGFLYDNIKNLDYKQVKTIKALYENRKKGPIICEQQITYKLARSEIAQLGWGRLYGTCGSFETLERQCRGTICKEYYHDIDIKNCHPVLLSQFATRYFNQDMPELDKLCANREEYMKIAGGTRDQAKEEIIRIIYGGKPENKFFDTLYQEILLFTKKIAHFQEYAQLFDLCKKTKNIYHSFISYVLQTEERKCMLAMKAYLESKKWSVDVLAYDGVMVKKREDVSIGLRELEAYIKDVTGYTLELTEKEMESFPEYDTIKDSGESIEGIPIEIYKDMKREFETNNFYFSPTNEYIEYTRGEEPQRMSLEHATAYYNGKWVHKVSERFGDYITFFPIWRKDLTKKTIKMLDMKPSNDPEVFSCPPIFKYQKTITHEPSEDISQPIKHFHTLLNIVTKDNPEIKNYLIKWLAHLIQQPFENPGVALIVTGKKGAGKDTLFDFIIQKVIGNNYGCSYGSTNQFFDKHDTGRMNKFLVKLEEANRQICYKNADELKARITAFTTTFNPKNQKPITCANYTRYVFTTNGACPVELTDNERRFLLIPASTEYQGNADFWTMIREELFTDKAGRVIAEYLLDIDISDFNVRKYPKTIYQEDITDSKKTVEEMFVEQWDGKEMFPQDFYTAYTIFATEKQLPYIFSLYKLAKSENLQKLKRDGVIKVKKTSSNTIYYK
jgi:hypothetical protein